MTPTSLFCQLKRSLAFGAHLRLLRSDGVETRQPCGKASEPHGKSARAAADGATGAEAVPWVSVALWQEDDLCWKRENARHRM